MADKDAECPLGAAIAHSAQAFLGKDILRDKRSPSLVSSENDRECKHVYTVPVGVMMYTRYTLKPAHSRTVGKPQGPSWRPPDTPIVVRKALITMKFSANLSFLFQEHKDLKDRCV